MSNRMQVARKRRRVNGSVLGPQIRNRMELQIRIRMGPQIRIQMGLQIRI